MKNFDTYPDLPSTLQAPSLEDKADTTRFNWNDI